MRQRPRIIPHCTPGGQSKMAGVIIAINSERYFSGHHGSGTSHSRMVAEADQQKLDEQFIEPVMENWPGIRDARMEEWDLDKEDLVRVFGSVRDKWITNDQLSWLTANKFFPDVVNAINSATGPVYIITTKQTRFAHLLLEHNKAKIPLDHIYGFEKGSKISVLKELIAMPDNRGKQVVFVEDRYETLEKVSLSMLGQPLQLFLATWGYNTQQVREVAEKHPFITLLDLPTFVNKFQ
ncbi:HAD-like protein [Gracilaria domingensis]|nr:HAD-like protein [Gracilaria domingensis]